MITSRTPLFREGKGKVGLGASQATMLPSRPHKDYMEPRASPRVDPPALVRPRPQLPRVWGGGSGAGAGAAGPRAGGVAAWSD